MKNSIPFSALLFSGLFFISYSAHTQGINIGTGGNMVITGAATIQIDNGGLVNNGTYTKGTETVTFSGNTAQTLSGNNIDMYNLSVTNTAGITPLVNQLKLHDLTIANLCEFTINPGKAVEVTNTLTNNAGVTGLIIESSAASNGSLIQRTNGVLATTQRYMTSGVWHIVSIPVSGQAIGSFVSNASNFIGYNITLSKWGMMPYDPTGNVWGSFFDGTEVSTFNTGEGYMVRRKTSSSAGIITTTGGLQGGDLNISTLTAGKWNCIGNPYTSSIGVTASSSATSNFLTANAANLETSFGAIYIWDEQPNYISPTQRSDYVAINNNGYVTELVKSDLQVGQGFLVKMGAASTSLSFTEAMKIHDVAEPYLKKSTVSWPGFELFASTATLKNSTIITYFEGMTEGLDPTFDAGAIKGNPNLAIYTRLIETNGNDFIVQCLPLDGIESFEIPVGVDFPGGGDLTFSAKTDLIPFGSQVILEDRLNNTFTDLVTNSAGYTINLPASTYGTGRFYLHTGDGNSNSIPINKENLNVYSFGNKIYINGEITQESEIMLYSILGELVRIYNPESSNNKQLNADGLVKGVYLLKIRDKQFIKTYKLFIDDGL